MEGFADGGVRTRGAGDPVPRSGNSLPFSSFPLVVLVGWVWWF